MICQNCGRNEADTFLKKTINGKTTTTHLCGECALRHSAGTIFGKIGFDIGDFWNTLFAEPAEKTAAEVMRCKGCGRSFEDMAKTGKAGCPACYTTFYNRLLPSIQRIHGKTRHTGKIPEGACESLKMERELEQLRRELNECIAGQQFEKCAGLRDRIREIEKKEEA